MATSNSSLSKFIEELRNRRVFRVATVYLGTSFVLLEAADIIMPRLGLPDWSVTLIMVLMAIGLPIAIGLAWTFQFTPDGLKRSPKSGEKQSPDAKPFTGNAIIIVLLALILGVLAYPRFFDGSGNESNIENAFASLDPKSVAVLPFTPFTKTVEDESFADGVHDDILTQLSKIAELKVISRTSVMQYKETTQNIADIAQDLGVANVLEGSVRRAGEKVRIVAQLINAKTDEHLWAETYDREYADIFAVQSDVAKKIARALKAELTPQEQQYIETKPTENQDAWELYMRAELLMNSPGGENDSIGIALFEEAAQLDPEFLLPLTRLARHQSHYYFDGSGRDPSPDRMVKAKAALDRAIAIDADAPETRIAQGYFYYYGSRDYQQALEEFYVAQERQPNNSDLFAAIAYVERRLGHWEAAWENLEKAVSLDPNNTEKVFEARGTAQRMRKWNEAEKYQKRFSAIMGGNDFSVEQATYWISLDQYGDVEKLQDIFDDLLARFGEDEMRERMQWHAYFSRDFPHGLELNEVEEEVNYWSRANWLRMNDRDEEAKAYFDSALVEVETRIADNSEDWDALGDKGRLLARLGQHEEAIEWGKRAVQLMPMSRDALLGPEALDHLMSIYLICGEHDRALDLIDQLLSIPSYMNIADLRIGPHFDPLRDHPRFQLLLKVDS